MTARHSSLGKLKHIWLAAWPLWTLIVFAGLAAVRLLPSGFVRTVVAVPILLLVPGSLTLGAAFSRTGRPRGLAFICYAALLGALWSALASLLLYALSIPITGESTYWCLLAVSSVLAALAGLQILLGRQGTGRRAAHKPDTMATDLSAAEARHASMPVTAKATALYTMGAIVAGAGLLGGGLYAYDHSPHPTPVAYTWMAWTGPQVTGSVPIGSAGADLHFQIVHHQMNTAAFRLSAAWLSSPPEALAKSLTLSIGPNRTFHGTLFIPPLPDGCTYRIVVTLTPVQRTGQPQSWTLNADVHDPGKPLKTCK